MKMMNELSVAMKARQFVAKCGHSALPVSVEAYAAEIGGFVKKEKLGDNEDAWSFSPASGKYVICVNCAHNNSRQRFSVCHEVAHVVLGISTAHEQNSWSYAQRPQGEILCDVFAAELLLPYKLFKPRVDTADIGIKAISALSGEFEASFVATGSRFATFSREPCAFVLSEEGKVRYCARSTTLREGRAWIKLGSTLPAGSYSARVRGGEDPTGPEEAVPDQWFEDWESNGTLYEDALHLHRWDQTLTLLWFEEDEVSGPRAARATQDEELYGMRELDGNLPWPGRRRRR